ncbi:MAG: flavin reductase family protein [Anaerolineaceae bacterium]|nr:flavin reductase family protein [Anaerolineaceae bacterium]
MTTKKQLGPVPLIYPVPIALVGVLVDGKPNVTEVGDVGIMGIKPPYVFVSLGEKSHSKLGITQTGQFSLNFPNTALMSKADYCGTASGHKVDKASLFTIFTDPEALPELPLIEDCPVNLACEVVEHVILEHRNIFIGKVIQTYVNEDSFVEVDGKRHLADLTVLDPLIYALDNRYYKIGDPIGTGYQEGKAISAPNNAE